MAVFNSKGIRIDSESSGSSVFISVTDFGATGDGTANDTSSIQAALNSAQTNGGVIYFPVGNYLITSKLIFYSNQILLFEKGAVLKQGGAIDCLLMSYCGAETEGYGGTHDCLIYGATFDGGSYTTNNTLVGTVHAKNITIENCTFVNAYGSWHDLEINSTYNAKILNCDFEGARKTAVNGEMIQIDAINNVNTWPWSDNRGVVDSTVSKYVEVAGCVFHNDTISPAIGNHSEASDSFIRIHDNVFDGLTSTRGAINMQSSDNVDIYNNSFNGCTIGVGTSGATYSIYNNRFVDVTTARNGSGNIHNNMINGTYTA